MKNRTVVIEMRGGVVQEVYTDSDTSVVLVDWDEREDDATALCAAEMKPFPLAAMPPETEEQVAAISDDNVR